MKWYVVWVGVGEEWRAGSESGYQSERGYRSRNRGWLCPSSFCILCLLVLRFKGTSCWPSDWQPRGVLRMLISASATSPCCCSSLLNSFSTSSLQCCASSYASSHYILKILAVHKILEWPNQIQSIRMNVPSKNDVPMQPHSRLKACAPLAGNH